MKKHEKMEISILHIYKSNRGPSNSDGSNTMDGSNLFESPANFPYIFKLKKCFPRTLIPRTVELNKWSHQ